MYTRVPNRRGITGVCVGGGRVQKYSDMVKQSKPEFEY